MLASENRSKEKDAVEPVPELKTEDPLAEKDQQGQATERARKLGQEALKQWRSLKQKIVNEFKR
jgi:hypothetical protein